MYVKDKKLRKEGNFNTNTLSIRMLCAYVAFSNANVTNFQRTCSVECETALFLCFESQKFLN